MVDSPPRRHLPFLANLTMKVLPILLAASYAAHSAELPVGSVSTNQGFAVRSGSSFTDQTLEAYEGKILVIMMMTPWCPFCQSNARAVASGILSPFNASTRGALSGKNDHGVEIDSLLLSTEPASQWDNTNSSFAASNGYENWGLDANAQRLNPRAMLGYYRGGFPNNINSGNLYDWEDDRRRVVVLNLVRNSASHDFREIVINQNFFSSSDAAAAQGLINEITPAPPVSTFSEWSGTHDFPTGTDGAGDDPDSDGCVNLLEFLYGTDPLQSSSCDPGPSLIRDGTGLKLVYRRARNIGGFTLRHMTSTSLDAWQVVTPSAPPTMISLGDVDEITVPLPASTDPARFYQLEITQGSPAP